MPKNWINSDATAVAARAIKSPCAVLVSVNSETKAFDFRMFAEHDGWRDMAERMTDALEAALDADPPAPRVG